MGSNVALITGRGGSTFKGKNIKEIFGIPVLGYAALSVNATEIFDYKFCSSDCDDILRVAFEYGFEPIKRPPELATANALHIDTIEHAINLIEEMGVVIDNLYVFLANNACVTPQMISDAHRILIETKNVTSVVPIYREMDHHPLRAMKIESKSCLLVPFVDRANLGKISSNRQDLTPAYFLCHNFWAISLANQRGGWNGCDPWPFLGNSIRSIEVGALADIHSEADIESVKQWVSEFSPFNNLNYVK